MNEEVSVTVSTNQISRDRSELVLETKEGAQVRWSKLYDGAIFLNMDAQSLGLIVASEGTTAAERRFTLKREAVVKPNMLRRMRFTESR